MKRSSIPTFLWLIAACSSGPDSAVGTTDLDTTGSADPGEASAAPDDDAMQGDDGSGDPTPSPDAGTESPDGDVSESFEGPDGDPWPSPWTSLGGVTDHELDDGRGRLQGPPHTVARMGLTTVDALDFDVEVTFELTDFFSQGFGLYVRQNGGWLVHTDPPGQGYAVYLEGGFQQQLGVWRERDGVEELLGGIPLEPLDALVPYRVRLECVQMENATLLRTKLWRASDPEPEAWAVELIDVTAELQDVTGGIAVDLYNYEGNGSLYVDDLVMRPPAE